MSHHLTDTSVIYNIKLPSKFIVHSFFTKDYLIANSLIYLIM